MQKIIIVSLIMLSFLSQYSQGVEPYIRHLKRSGLYEEEFTDYKEEINNITPSSKLPPKELKEMKLYASLIEPANYFLQYLMLLKLKADYEFLENVDKFTAPPRVPKDVFQAIVERAKVQSRGCKLDYLCAEVDAYRELIERKIKPNRSNYARQMRALLDLP